MSLKILVCAKRVVDPNLKVHVRADGRGMQLDGLKTVLNPFDEVAVEEAVRLREAGHAHEVVAVSVGPAGARDALRSALAIGADRALLVDCGDDPEPLAAARFLAALVRREAPDLVLMGKQSTDHDLGQTPAMLAGLLGWPQALQVSKLQVQGTALQVICELDQGTELLQLPLPALLSADLRLNEPRYASLPAVMKAKKKPLDIISAASLGLGDDRVRLSLLKASTPQPRAAGRIVPDAPALLAALRDEARVL